MPSLDIAETPANPSEAVLHLCPLVHRLLDLLRLQMRKPRAHSYWFQVT